MQSDKNPASVDPVQRFLVRAHYRVVLPYIAAGLLLVLGIIVAGRAINHHINAIESWIASLGPWGMVAFVGFFVVGTSLLLPDTVLCLVAGVLFGFGWGVAAVMTGSLLAGTLQFALSHYVLQARIQRALAAKPSLVAIQQAVKRDEFRLQVLLRLTPLNPATINYLLGAAGVRFGGFLIACFALVFNLTIEVYFGHATKRVAMMAGGSAHIAHLHDLAIIGGLVMCAVVMVLVSRMARKAVMRAVAVTAPPANALPQTL